MSPATYTNPPVAYNKLCLQPPIPTLQLPIISYVSSCLYQPPVAYNKLCLQPLPLQVRFIHPDGHLSKQKGWRLEQPHTHNQISPQPSLVLANWHSTKLDIVWTNHSQDVHYSTMSAGASEWQSNSDNDHHPNQVKQELHGPFSNDVLRVVQQDITILPVQFNAVYTCICMYACKHTVNFSNLWALLQSFIYSFREEKYTAGRGLEVSPWASEAASRTGL